MQQEMVNEEFAAPMVEHADNIKPEMSPAGELEHQCNRAANVNTSQVYEFRNEKQHSSDVEVFHCASQQEQLVSANDAAVETKESLSKCNTELQVKQQRIDFLELQAGRVKSMEKELAEKDVMLEKLKQELQIARESEPNMVKEPEDCHIKEIEETKVLLEQAKLTIASLQNNVQSLEDSVAKSNEDLDAMHQSHETLKSQLEVAKEEREFNILKVKSLNQEIIALRNEHKSATEAEEKSRKAMDDLALVLIEVTNENKEVKESLSSTKSELDSAREEAEHANKLLEEAKKENEQLKSECQRLKLEADDSVLAWNLKELEFVGCIKRAEEESDASKQDNAKLKTSLRTAEAMANAAREENCKVRDILKQALNESCVAKETAEIAKAENSQLKEELSDKEDMLEKLTREIERLRIKETASYETIKELKKLLSLKSENKDSERIVNKQTPYMVHNESQNIKEILNIKFEEPQIRTTIKKQNEDPEIDEMLKGSIFDVAESPVAPRPVLHHRKMSSTVFSDAEEEEKFHDLEPADTTAKEDAEDKNSQRKKRALLRRFGDLMRITSYIRRETPVS